MLFGVYCGQDIVDYTVRPFRVVDDIWTAKLSVENFGTC